MGCTCARITGLAEDPFEFLISGWLNGEGTKVYVGDDYVPTQLDEYTFPGFSFVKTVVSASALNVLSAAAGSSGDVFTWENGTFNGVDYDFDLWKYNTGTDSSSLLASVTRAFVDVPRMIYSFADDYLYAMWPPDASGTMYRYDPSTGAETLVFDADSNAVGVTEIAGRPCYTSDSLLWIRAKSATHWGLVEIDLSDDSATFYALQTVATVTGVGSPVADESTVYISFTNVSTQTNYKVTAGASSTVACDYGDFTPYLGVLDENDRGLYQGFGVSEIQIWHWQCARWWLGVAGWSG